MAEAFRRKGREQLDQQVAAAGGDAAALTKIYLHDCALPAAEHFSPARFPRLTHLSLECMKPR